MIDGAPQVVTLAIDLHEDLVEMPTPVAGFHALDPALPDLRSEHRPEPMPPKSDRLVANVDAPLVQQVFDVPERQREPDIHHHCQGNDLGSRLGHRRVLSPCRLSQASFLKHYPDHDRGQTVEVFELDAALFSS